MASHDSFDMGGSAPRKSIMTRAIVLLFMLLLAACSDQESSTQQPPNETIESPLQMSDFVRRTYPPEPVLSTGSINAKSP
jgi:hypothetical protein